MQERYNAAPDAAQSLDATDAAIEAQRLRDEAWFRGHPGRGLLARLLTGADLDELDQIGCSLAEIPPGYQHAIVVGEDAQRYGRREDPVAVPAVDAARLDAMTDGEILVHLGRNARHFFCFVRDKQLVDVIADQLSRQRRRRPDWPETLRNAPRNRAKRIARLDILRRHVLDQGRSCGMN